MFLEEIMVHFVYCLFILSLYTSSVLGATFEEHVDFWCYFTEWVCCVLSFFYMLSVLEVLLIQY